MHDQHANGRARRTRSSAKAGADDAQLLEGQASLNGTDVEVPALVGALLATRKEAVKRGLLSQASFGAGLAPVAQRIRARSRRAERARGLPPKVAFDGTQFWVSAA